MFCISKNMKTFSKRINLTPNNASVRRQVQPLTPEQVEFYKDNGYFIVKQLFSHDDLDMFRKRFVELCNGVDRGQVSFVKDKELYKPGLKSENYINKIQELLYDKVYMRFSESPQLLDIISQLIGDDITAVSCMFINKPPGSCRHPPHQDLYFFPFRPADKIVAVWTAIDPVNVDNGCLYVIPGSHKANVLYQMEIILRLVKNESETSQLFLGIVDEESVAPMNRRSHLVMDPGDTVFFHPSLVHGSGPNCSKNYRKALTCHYANSSCQYIDVTGTIQEPLASQMESLARRLGGELSFVDIWKVKTKQVQGVRSNL